MALNMLHSHLPSSRRSDTRVLSLFRSNSWIPSNQNNNDRLNDSNLHTTGNDWKSGEAPVIQLGRRRRVGFIALIPAVITMLFSAGFSTALIVWLLEKRILDHLPNEDDFFRGSIVAIESSSGPRTGADGSVTSESTFYGLVISSTASHLISLTVSFLMALVAYRLAADWLHDQSLATRQDRLPTPAQYGLLLRLCGSSNISSAWDTCRYLWASKDTTPRAPASLKNALWVLIFVLFLTDAIGAADFWLHTTASSFIHTSLEQLSDMSLPLVGTDINTTDCPHPVLTPRSPELVLLDCANSFATLEGPGPSGMVNQGAAVAANKSEVNTVVLVGETAVLLPSSMPPDLGEVVFSTFGLTTQCTPVTQCSIRIEDSNQMNATIDCSSFSPDLVFSLYNEIGGSLEPYNFTRDNENFLNSSQWESPINPYGTLIQLQFTSEEGIQVVPDNASGFYNWHPWSTAITCPCKSAIASCITTAHNVTLSYTPSNFGTSPYSIVQRDLSNINTTSALLAVAASNLNLIGQFISHLHSTLDTSLDTVSADNSFFTLLSESVSVGLLSFASPLMERTPSHSAKRIVLQNASRYPLAPLCTIIVTLYAYALLAFILCFWTAFSTSHEVVVHVDQTPRPVTVLELAQLRLTDPLAFVAQHFAGSSCEPNSSLETSALQMFGERENEQRLRVGLFSVREREDDSSYNRKAFGISRVGEIEEEIPLNSEL